MCVVGQPCKANWAEPLPDECPSQSASNASGQTLYRFVETNPPTAADFWSNVKKGKTVSPSVTPCAALSVSMMKTLERARLKQKLPYWKSHHIAALTLPAGSGAIYYGSRDHVDWWPCGAFKPLAAAVMVA